MWALYLAWMAMLFSLTFGNSAIRHSFFHGTGEELKVNITALLNRTWVNQDGSVMVMTVKEEKSSFAVFGSYDSEVGSDNGDYPFFGRGTSENGVLVFSWQIVWNNGKLNSHSVSAWIAYLNTKTLGSGPLQFNARWMLTRPGPFDWNCTEIGQDTFSVHA